MKFIYVDESGGRDESDVFVMCGLMVDAYKLRRRPRTSTPRWRRFLRFTPDARRSQDQEVRKRRGSMGPRSTPKKRKNLLRGICQLAVANGGKVYGLGLSFQRLDQAAEAGHGQPFAANYWVGAAMFVSALVQKKMQGVASSKGLTVVIMDDNKKEMPHLSNGLYHGSDWYDLLYQCRGSKRGKRVWLDRTQKDRFDQIINTAFAIKSDHSSSSRSRTP